MTEMLDLRGFDVHAFDRNLHAAEAKITGGLSPSALMGAYMDWATHLANQPGKRTLLARQAMQESIAMWSQACGMAVETLAPELADHRFSHPGWQTYPASLFAQGFLRTERWWMAATTDTPGVACEHERIVAFMARQLLDMVAPTNMPMINPEIIAATRATQGKNLLHGFENFVSDLKAKATGETPALPLLPGRDVAITPGNVVFRNELIELMQYIPTTGKVRPEPMLIVPAWIMKYYILDLSPHNSMIAYLVAQGFTVFCVSWLNPGAEQRDVSLEDYRVKGVMASIDAVSAICGNTKIHGVGYCLGGTLLTIAAAAMADAADTRLKTLTLLAAQTDFTEAGELQLFINAAQLAFLDDIMWKQGYLDSAQMAGAFAMLRSNDMIWSHLLRRYFLGEDDHPNDMMSWDEDATRMPYRMHSEYLRKLFLNNELAEGRLVAAGKPVSIGDIAVPFFVIGTETDHIAPWHSVHKLHLLNAGDITFVLTSGGHNAGVVSEPGHARRHFRILERKPHDNYRAPDDWMAAAKLSEGSWWPAWVDWLGTLSAPPVKPPAMGNKQAGYSVLEAAPGSYVLRR